MFTRFKIGGIKVTFTVARVVKVIGVNSTLNDGNHIIMWDFDHKTLREIKRELGRVQIIYQLPDIVILRSSEPDNYIAYCFKRCDWVESMRIVLSTEGIDLNFFKYGVYRGHWTLRVTEKLDTYPYRVGVLHGYSKPDVDFEDLRSWVRYETLGGK